MQPPAGGGTGSQHRSASAPEGSQFTLVETDQLLSSSAVLNRGSPGVTGYSYDGVGNQTGSGGPSGAVTNTFNRQDQLVHLIARRAAPLVQDPSYALVAAPDQLLIVPAHASSLPDLPQHPLGLFPGGPYDSTESVSGPRSQVLYSKWATQEKPRWMAQTHLGPWRRSMAAIPDMAMRSLDAAWNRARWETLPDDGHRYEVIDGVLYMSTSPSAFHQWIVGQIYTVLRTQVDARRVGVTLLAPLGVLMPGCDPVQPDVLVVRREDLRIIRTRIEGVPALLVEVLSPSNANADTEIKRRAYARAGVPEYWIVRPAQRDVLVYTQPDAALADFAQSAHFDAADDLASPTLPVRTLVASFFADAPSTVL